MKHTVPLVIFTLIVSCASCCPSSADEPKEDALVPTPMETKLPEALKTPEPDAAIWDQWHKKLAEELFKRIRKDVEVSLKNPSRLQCTITYRISRNGEIDQLQIEGTNNILFRAIVAHEVKGLQSCPLIVFPKGIQSRPYVLKRSQYGFGMNNPTGRIGDFDSTINRKIPFVDGKKVPSK